MIFLRKRAEEREMFIYNFNVKILLQQLRYKIDHLTAEDKYRFNLNVSVCLESSGACDLDFPVMTDVDIPIIDCDFENVSYAVQGQKNQYLLVIFKSLPYLNLMLGVRKHSTNVDKIIVIKTLTNLN